jgi:hypothetical protein
MANPDESLKQQTPQTIEVIEVIENEDQVLSYTQKQRQKIVHRLITKKHEELESSDKTMLLMALDGMDRSALGRKRLKSDEKIGASQAAAAALIAQVLQAPGAMHHGLVVDGVINRIAPQLPATLPDPKVVPGEMDADAAQMDYDTFMAQPLD